MLVHLFLAVFAAKSSIVVAVATTREEVQSYVEIGARSFEVHSQKAVPSPSSRRLIRQRDAEPKPGGSASEASALAEETVSSEIAVGSVLDRTIHTFSHRKESLLQASLLEERGPGHLANAATAADAWVASVGAMKNLSKSLTFDCNANYGQGMLEKLMDGRYEHHVCSGHRSTITCHERYPFDVPRYTCELKNVMISVEGTTVADCQKSGDFDSFAAKQGITENNIFGKATKFGGLNFVDGPLRCAKNASGRPALVQVPANTVNFYEWCGDWVTLWETMAALKWEPKDTEVYLVGTLSGDGRQFARPFDEAWSRAFTAANVHVGGYDELFGKGVCFPHIVTVPQGTLSTMTYRGGRGGVVACPSPTVMGSAMYLQALFQQPKMDLTKPTRRVTLMLRKGVRKFENDDNAIQKVKQALPKDWTLQIYRPEEMKTLQEQLDIAASTQVFVGVHGAGMMHVLFLPPRARVVEIFCEDRPRENHHYRNLEEMGEPAVGPHLFSYYFEASPGRCSVDASAVSDAIKAYDKNPPASIEFSADALSSH